MMWLFSLFGTLAGILVGTVILIVWVLFKETARELVRLAKAVRGARRPCRATSAVPDPETVKTAPGGARIYYLHERRPVPGRERRQSSPG